MSIIEELKKRNLPEIKSREEMMEILQREEYGYLPKTKANFSVSEPEILEKRLDGGNVHIDTVDFTLSTENKSHTFPLFRLLHQDGKKHPLIIFLSFSKTFDGKYLPIEELSENEFDIVYFYYQDATTDDGDFSTGVAPLLLPEGRKSPTDCGKIAMWAWSAMRVLDYALTLPGTDAENVAILGHSRLGKTAAFTAMMDERFKFGLSNNAGCAGDSLAHGCSGNGLKERDYTKGETIRWITEMFPFWFCENYYKYGEKNYADDFDQHYLLGAIAPRYVCVASCDKDYWADPIGQQMCCLAASAAFENQGLKGLVHNDEIINPGEALLDGHIGYFKINSLHFLSRHCWQKYFEFIRKHK